MGTVLARARVGMSIRSAHSEAWVEAITAYLPHHYLEHDELAAENGTDPQKYARGLGSRSQAVLHPMQDAVTMAAEAGLSLLEGYGVDPGSVGQLIVATESGVDWAKPIASYVHEMIGLRPRCRTYDVQHACYGASAALASVGAWIASGMAGGRKALVIATDVARYDEGSPGEATQGAGAVALLLGEGLERRVLRPDLGAEAVHSHQVMDFWRPGHRSTAVVNGKYSVSCYLSALIKTWRYHRGAGGRGPEDLDYLLFHLPFPRMSEKALRTLLEAEWGGVDEDVLRDVFETKVAPGVEASRLVGNIYSGSLYLGLASLLEHEGPRCAGGTAGLFSYGSGSCAEFFTARIGEARDWEGLTGVEKASNGRNLIGMQTYRAFRRESARLGADGSFRLGHLPCADSVPDDVRFVFLGYRKQRRVYAPGPSGRCARVQEGPVSRTFRRPAGPAT